MFKKLYFGHHRLVAKKKLPPEERRRLLQDALTKKLSVAKFDAYIKKDVKDKRRREESPTNADAVADTVVKLCNNLASHASLKSLSKGEPPDRPHRQKVIAALKDTADRLTEKAEQLPVGWEHFDLLHYHAAAGSGR